MCILGNQLKVDVLIQLHVLGVDAEHFETPDLVRHADVDLAIKPSESPQGRVDAVGTVRRAHDDDVRAGLHAIHQCQQLGDDAPLDLAVSLLPVRSNGVDLVDEDDRGRVLLSLLEGLPQVALALSGHLRHYLLPVDKEEEGPGLVGHRTGDQRLAGPWRAVQEDALGRLDANALEDLRMPKWQLDELPDESQRFPHATHVIVADVVKPLLVLPLDRLTLAEYLRVGRHDTVVHRGVDLHDLELDAPHAAAHEEEVALVDRAEGVHEVGLEVGVEEVARDALDGVVQREDVHALTELGVVAQVHGHDVGDAHAQVGAGYLVDPELVPLAGVVGQCHADRVVATFALEQHDVVLEYGELLHCGRVEVAHGVVVVGGGLLHHQPVRRLL
ncbi:uncharacterized protein LOC119343017 [Triticum dicoccoides]|uniref:uncharacterized protein LOC119343017 n=1 Tax=Triticum dicoccoides TaxID=85692 RepID=UPI00188EFDFF|nr:uncharacterized protein LOC119343017 [Triticum dicoccoides]